MYASKLKALREQKNIKQLYAASIIAIQCQQHYSDFESGKKNFSDEVIKNICDGFKVSIEDFKKINFDILDELIHNAGLNEELQTYIKKTANKEHQLYLMECERRLVEIKLENARKNMEILNLHIDKVWIPHGEVPRIYVMA